MNKINISDLKDKAKNLRKGVQVKDKSAENIQNIVNIEKAAVGIREVTGIKNNNDRIKYFFDAGVDEWYEPLKKFTFASSFITINSMDEVEAIVSQKRDAHTLEILEGLRERLDICIKSEPHFGSAFVKLSSRSPKDSKTVLAKAENEFHHGQRSARYNDLNDNDKWAAFSNEVRSACKVTNGAEALDLLLDSERVREDFKYALEYDGEESVLDLIKIVVRTFDDRVKTRNEFRGFVWNGKFVCVGQYFSKIYFPELVNLKDKVAADLISFFENQVSKHVQIPCYMMDLVWLESGEVILVEINPFDGEELGAFPASTGLFDWYEDRDVMTGLTPFQIRVLEAPISQMDRARGSNWSDNIYKKVA